MSDEFYSRIRAFGGISVEYVDISEAVFAAAAGYAYVPPERGDIRRTDGVRKVQLLSDCPGVIETFQTSAATLRLPANTAAEATNDAGNGRIFYVVNNGTGDVIIEDSNDVSQHVLASNSIVIVIGNQNNTWDFFSGSGSVVTGGIASVQARRTTDYVFTTSWADISFDTTDGESDPTVLEHDNTNTERVLIKEDGNYEISFTVPVNALSTADFKMRVQRNGTTTVPGSYIWFRDGSYTHEISNDFIAYDLEAGDYLTLQFDADCSPGDGIAKADIIWVVQSCKGPKGDVGAAGADGDITWEGDWVSGNYTVNQSVFYQGSSYVCHTNTTSNQNPTNADYWDPLALKGDQGPAGADGGVSDIELNFCNQASPEGLEVGGSSFSVAGRMRWPGSTRRGTPTAIKTLVREVGSGGLYVRIYDATNDNTIVTSSERTTGDDWLLYNPGSLSNISSGEAIWEIQLRHNSYNGTAQLAHLTVEF